VLTVSLEHGQLAKQILESENWALLIDQIAKPDFVLQSLIVESLVRLWRIWDRKAEHKVVAAKLQKALPGFIQKHWDSLVKAKRAFVETLRPVLNEFNATLRASDREAVLSLEVRNWGEERGPSVYAQPHYVCCGQVARVYRTGKDERELDGIQWLDINARSMSIFASKPYFCLVRITIAKFPVYSSISFEINQGPNECTTIGDIVIRAVSFQHLLLSSACIPRHSIQGGAKGGSGSACLYAETGLHVGEPSRFSGRAVRRAAT
jgi:hypothetical protein